MRELPCSQHNIFRYSFEFGSNRGYEFKVRPRRGLADQIPRLSGREDLSEFRARSGPHGQSRCALDTADNERKGGDDGER